MAVYDAGDTDFRAGRVVARSFSTLFRNILPFGLLALVLISPTYVYRILAGPPDYMDYEGMGAGLGMEFILALVDVLLTYLVTAALVYGTIEDLRNNKVSVGECFSRGLARMFPVFGVALVTSLVMMLAFLPVALGAFVPYAIPLLIIPGLMAIVALWVTIPVAVVERRGIGSLGRSMELTRGYRWRIFFVLLILAVIVIALSLLIGAVVAGIVIGGGEVDVVSPGAVAMEWILSALIAMFFAVMYAVSYHDLRVAKDGVDTEQIASVFD